MTDSSSAYSAARHRAVPFWRDIRVLRVIAQIVFVILVLAIGAWLLGNYRSWLAERNLTFTFRFLRLEASFDLAEGIPFKPTDSYARAFLVGVVNTLRVASVGIVLATLLGLVTGVARLSRNWLVSHIASVYIELIRNTPLLVSAGTTLLPVFRRHPQAAPAQNEG